MRFFDLFKRKKKIVRGNCANCGLFSEELNLVHDDVYHCLKCILEEPQPALYLSEYDDK